MLPLFEGQEGHIIPVHSVDTLSSGCFYIAGQMIAHCLVNGGVGMVVMSKAVSRYIASESTNAEHASTFLTVDDIPDLDTRNVLLKASWVLYKYFITPTPPFPTYLRGWQLQPQLIFAKWSNQRSFILEKTKETLLVILRL